MVFLLSVLVDVVDGNPPYITDSIICTNYHFSFLAFSPIILIIHSSHQLLWSHMFDVCYVSSNLLRKLSKLIPSTFTHLSRFVALHHERVPQPIKAASSLEIEIQVAGSRCYYARPFKDQHRHILDILVLINDISVTWSDLCESESWHESIQADVLAVQLDHVFVAWVWILESLGAFRSATTREVVRWSRSSCHRTTSD